MQNKNNDEIEKMKSKLTKILEENKSKYESQISNLKTEITGLKQKIEDLTENFNKQISEMGNTGKKV